MNLPPEIDGRYPGLQPAIMDRANLRVSFQPCPHVTVIRVDDVGNPDFWLELKLTRSDLQWLLERMR